MSAAKIETSKVAGFTHPEWCDLDKCDPNAVTFGKPGGTHYSTGLVWGLQSDEAEFMVELVRSDDYDPRTRENVGDTRLRVTLQQMVGNSDDPRSGCYADAWVDPADARLLATFLTRYADMAERSDRFPNSDLAADEVPRRKRTF